MRRVSMVGTSGSGKTTVGRALAARLDIPFVELDAIHNRPGWTELPREEFRSRVRAVVDGNYSAVRDLVSAAPTPSWIDLPRATVMRQLLPRTLGRMIGSIASTRFATPPPSRTRTTST